MLEEHKYNSPKEVQCAVLTVSESRTKQNDKSGKLMIELLKKEGHAVTCYEVVPDEAEIIKASVKLLVKNNEVDVIILSGGTGIAGRDVTIEVVQPLFSKEIPGFGELFRMISYEENGGTSSMLTRATCGVINHRLLFMIPGTESSVQLALKKLILPEIAQAVYELKKDLHGENKA